MTPRPNTRLAVLHALLHAMARTGEALPTLGEIGVRMGGIRADEVSDELRRGEAAGHWAVVRAQGRGILSVSAADGAWVLHGHGSRAAARAKLPPRRCLRCRENFEPEHRHNFLCVPCGIYAKGTV